ncbi:hypothetical protein [Streptomyces lincolnensis]|uniref:hypothetical protein n=1 Tax=Streptomyces lincolnensis TaxID=1915 RepID=UPI0037D49EA0
MPSYDDQSQPAYHPTVPVPAVYQPAPMQPYGQHPAQAPVVHPANGGMQSVVVVPLPDGQQAAYYSGQAPYYYMAPPPPPREPLLTPALVRAVVVAFVLLGGGIGGYFLFLALAELLKALAMFGMAAAGVVLAVVLLKIVSSGSGSRRDTINVAAKGRSSVQVHTSRGHNRGRRR